MVTAKCEPSLASDGEISVVGLPADMQMCTISLSALEFPTIEYRRPGGEPKRFVLIPRPDGKYEPGPQFHRQ